MVSLLISVTIGLFLTPFCVKSSGRFLGHFYTCEKKRAPSPELRARFFPLETSPIRPKKSSSELSLELEEYPMDFGTHHLKMSAML
jgi:hypothetical protein